MSKIMCQDAPGTIVYKDPCLGSYEPRWAYRISTWACIWRCNYKTLLLEIVCHTVLTLPLKDALALQALGWKLRTSAASSINIVQSVQYILEI